MTNSNATLTTSGIFTWIDSLFLYSFEEIFNLNLENNGNERNSKFRC